MTDTGFLAPPHAPATPTATYRLQFNRGFTFRDAARCVPYLDMLGVSHVYASPVLKARSGSPHGYDITDYNALNPEIGDDDDFNALVAALHGSGMGQIVDFIPNHLAIGKADNEWWLDVLEWGEASPYAGYFDIDWQPAKPDLRGKVLLPFLGDYYGNVLERGELVLAFDDAAGEFSVRYHDHRFPVSPLHDATMLAPGIERLRRLRGDDDAVVSAIDDLAGRFRALRSARASTAGRAALRARARSLRAELGRLAVTMPDIRAHVIDEALRRINGTPGDRRSFRLLHWLLDRQAYRLSYWRVAADEINYRRFFNINELAGVRMEDERLFETAHRLVLRLFAEGKIDGFRIDHIDGLHDPVGYCRRLLDAAEKARAGVTCDGGAPAYLVVEKILARHEALHEEWPIAGTTGYEMLNLINGLFVRPDAERALDRVYRRFVGARADFNEVLYASKKYVLEEMLASELKVLAIQLDRISESNWRTRDFTLAGLTTALAEVTASFPVYRTYVVASGPSAEDRRDIDWAVGQARRRAPGTDAALFDFIHAALTTDLVQRRRRGYNRRKVIDFAMRFQQFTGPVTAKAMEDTAFYRFVRLVSLNEVGGDPRRWGTTVAAFHHVNQERARHWPNAMTATSTHDTKWGEDVRARINVISEVPEEWSRRVRRWRVLNRRAKTAAEGTVAPAPNDEYLLYQALIGAWPMDLLADEAPAQALATFADRIVAYMVKAVREAKLHSSWAAPDAAYEDGLTAFVRRILDPARGGPFLGDARGFARALAVPGILNGLAQTLLKLTVPGVPDIYQGCELWDLSLVDPDNRRPVDYAPRIAALAGFAGDGGGGSVAPLGAAALRALLESWPDGRVKLYLVATLLGLRRRKPALFRHGAYLPLAVTGGLADHVCAFARVGETEACIVAAPRFFTALMGDAAGPPMGAVWRDTMVSLPDELAGRAWSNVLTGARIEATPPDVSTAIAAARLFASFPVAALVAPAKPRSAAGFRPSRASGDRRETANPP